MSLDGLCLVLEMLNCMVAEGGEGGLIGMMADRWQMQVMADRHEYERQKGFANRLKDFCNSRVAFATEKIMFRKTAKPLIK